MHRQETVKLAFLPGLDGTGISFELLSGFLPGNMATTVVRYPLDRLLSFEDTIACAHDQIHEGQDIIVAESFSGPVAVALLGSGRIKSKGLLLCATFARAPRQFGLRIAKSLPLELGFRFPFERLLLWYVLRSEKDRKLLESMWRQIAAVVPARTLAHRIRLLCLIDVRPLLPNITIPCWYILATKDKLVPTKAVADFAQAIPHLVIKKIAASHFVLQSEPEASAMVINKFLEVITPCRTRLTSAGAAASE